MSKRAPRSPASLTYDQFRRTVSERSLEPLYLFLGEEEYFHRQAIGLLFDTVDEAAREFNTAVVTIGGDLISASGASRKTTVADAIDIANMLPMMAARSIVVIRSVDKVKEDELELVLDYLKRPSPHAVVVFDAPSLDQRRKISSALIKACRVVKMDRLAEKDIQDWARGYIERSGSRIDRAALGQLIGLIGTSMSRLVSEMDKLIAYAGPDPISQGAVEQLVPRVREHTNWDLWTAIQKRDRERSIRLVRRLVEDGQEPIGIIAALASLYRRMLIAKDLRARGVPPQEIERATGQYRDRSQPFYTAVGRMPREEIVRGLRRIAKADNDAKNSIATAELQAEFLVAELTLPETACWSIVD
jgi:DNA polymerase-3 subunit delta